MKKYNEYKDSGIEWLGNIPEHWEVKRIKDIAKVKTGGKNTEDKKSEGKYPFFVRSQNVERINSFSFDGEAILTAGDGVGVGKVFHHYIGKFETHQRVYRISHFRKHNGRFLFNYLKQNLAKEVLKFNVKSTVDSLRMPMFLNFNVAFPSLKEQTQIANYLDAKTTVIDKKVNLLQHKIKHYKAYRKTLINETVTKGLDKTVKLKYSGINWIGEIPEHWEIKRIKDIFSISRGRAIGKAELKDKGLYPVYSSQTKNKGILGYINTYDFNANLLTWTTDGVNAGTVFIREGKFNCTNICGTLIPNRNPKLSLDYMAFAVQESTKHNKRIDTNGAKIMSNEMAVINIVFPPIEEQIKIANHIKSKTESISKVLQNIETQIITLKELRKTLINEVVTGKVRVSA